MRVERRPIQRRAKVGAAHRGPGRTLPCRDDVKRRESGRDLLAQGRDPRSPAQARTSTGNHEGEVGIGSQRASGTAVQRAIAVLGSAVFFVVAPFTLAGLVPWSITGWQLRPPFLGLELTRGIGVIMILAGAPGVVDSFARFALQGLGTPAPIAPPQKLVVTGLYRYARNPIYVGVVAVILGQALLFGDWRLLWYGALLWLFFHVWVVLIEEPTLERTFGREYDAFRAAVPRWIPRMTPWRSK
jgi:protein-S-isoprenylcysteine O-methyltransferase Ste14